MPGHRGSLRAKERRKAHHAEQIIQLAQRGSRQEAEHPERRREQAKILHPHRDDEKEQHLHLRVEHGKGQQEREGETVGVRPTRAQAGQHRPQHPQQEIEVKAEIAPLFFQCRADEPGEVDAQNHAQRPAARERHKHKRDDPPDLARQQSATVQIEVERNILVDKQLHCIDQDLTADQNGDQVGDAIAAKFPLQLGDPVHRQTPPCFKFCGPFSESLSAHHCIMFAHAIQENPCESLRQRTAPPPVSFARFIPTGIIF